MYLVRVQQRLISEAGPSNQDDSDALNEQMVSSFSRFVNFVLSSIIL